MVRHAFIASAMQAHACGQCLGMKGLHDIVCLVIHLLAGCSPTGLQQSMQCSKLNVAHWKVAVRVGGQSFPDWCACGVCRESPHGHATSWAQRLHHKFHALVTF